MIKRLKKKILGKYVYVSALLLLLMPALFFYSCDAPRNNPLDPQNPNYGYAKLTGTVQTFSLPFTSIAGVSVTWSPSGRIVTTGTDGKFTISNIAPVNGALIFQKSGYRSDTVNINWKTLRSINVVVNLNQIPKLDSISIYTAVINQFNPPQPNYELMIRTKISDRDNDIDSVFVQNSDINFRKALDFNVTGKIYQTDINTDEMNIIDIEETIGLDFNIIVKDIFNRYYNIGSGKVTRVIKDGAKIQFPANDTTIVTSPNLLWLRYKPGYPFTYTIEIYTNDFANSQLVLRAENISSDSTSYQVRTTLKSRDYYWVIWVVDNFQNRSRSLPATFRVQ